MATRSASALHVGNMRDHQEDGVFLDTEREVFAVIDGMGGHRSGSYATEGLQKLFPIELARRDTRHVFGPMGELFEEMNRKFKDASEYGVRARGQGACCTAITFQGEWCFLSQVGDTSGAVVRDGELIPLTKKHTLHEHLDELGAFPTRDEYDRFPHKNVIMRMFSGNEQFSSTGSGWRIAAGDRFLLCSDGLSDHLDATDCASIITESDTPEQAVSELMQAVLETEARDNISIVVIFHDDAPRPEPLPEGMTPQRAWGELRSALQAPHRDTWEEIVRLLDISREVTPSQYQEQLHYTREYLQRWPSHLHTPTPLRWLLDECLGLQTREELALCDTFVSQGAYFFEPEEFVNLLELPACQNITRISLNADSSGPRFLEQIATNPVFARVEEISFDAHTIQGVVKMRGSEIFSSRDWTQHILDSPHIQDGVKQALEVMVEEALVEPA